MFGLSSQIVGFTIYGDEEAGGRAGFSWRGWREEEIESAHFTFEEAFIHPPSSYESC